MEPHLIHKIGAFRGAELISDQHLFCGRMFFLRSKSFHIQICYLFEVVDFSKKSTT